MGRATRDITGERYGQLTVIGYDRRVGTHYKWRCRCDCGKEVSVCYWALQSGGTKSCGCYRKRCIREARNRFAQETELRYWCCGVG